jgi:hypothetical protein
MSEVKYREFLKENINVANAWNAFAAAVLPAEVSEVQRVEMRKAFYGGFSECFGIVQHLSDRLPEEEAGKVLSRLHDECNEFAAQLRRSL